MRKYKLLTMVTLALTLLAAGAFAQSAEKTPGMHSHPMMPAADKPATDEGGMMKCGDMATMHDAMKEKMAAMDAKLDGLVAEMNKAKGSARVEKMAAVITELVAQRSAMRDDMMAMQPMMMQHMAKHMQDGMMKGMSEGMSGCPMMNKGADKADSSKHDEHH